MKIKMIEDSILSVNTDFSKDSTKIAKGVAIVLMLCHHLFAFPDRLIDGTSYIPLFYIGEIPAEQWIGLFGKICVYMFLCLGGYGTYLSFKKCDSPYNEISRKIKALYVPYWKVFAVFIPVCMLLDAPQAEANLYTFLLNFTGLSSSYNAEWWFFLPYVVLTRCFPIVFNFVERKKSYFFGDILIASALQLFSIYFLPQIRDFAFFTPLQASCAARIISETLELLPTFYFGCVCAKYDIFKKTLSLFKNRITLITVSFLLIILSAYFYQKTLFEFAYLIAPLMCIVSAGIIQNIPLIPVIFRSIGKQSTNIWLIHSFYCYALCQKFIYSPGYSVLILLLLLGISWLSGELLDTLWSPMKTLTRIYDIIKKKTD